MTRYFLFQTFVMKESIQFRIRIDFLVQREIVTGLKYVQKTSRMGVTGELMQYYVLLSNFGSFVFHFEILLESQTN